MKSIIPFFLLIAFLVSCSTNAFSGNLSLIEKRLKEMDQLNKQAVKKAGNIPQNGSIEIQATVLPGMAKTRDLPGVTEKHFQFGKKTVLTLEQKLPYTVQISSSQGKKQSYRVASMLRRAGYPAFTSEVTLKENDIWYRIFVGSFATREETEVIKNNLETDEISDGLIRQLSYAIQIGKADSNMESIRSEKEKVFALEYLPYTSYVVNEDKTRQIRLLIGAFKTRENAAPLLASLRQHGLQARIVNR